MIPLLLFILLSIALIGAAIFERQNVLIAARFVAREASMNAMDGGFADKVLGKGVLEHGVNLAQREQYARRALAGRTVAVAFPGWDFEGKVRRDRLDKVIPIGGLARAYVATDPSGKYGLGFALYGQRVVSQGPSLEWLGKATNESARLVSAKRGKIWDSVGVGAEAYMPSELPVRGPGYGLMDTNQWIKDILDEPVE